MLLSATRQLAFALLAIVSCSAHSQELKIPDTPEKLDIAPPPSDRFPAKWYPRIGDGTDVLPAPVTDHPYTAVRGPIVPSTGEMLSRGDTGFQARDRFGRMRIEAGESGGVTVGGQLVKLRTVIVSDPVSHCEFQWSQPTSDVAMPPEMRVATVTCRAQTLRYKELDIVKAVFDAMPEGVSQHGDTTTNIEHLPPVKMDGLSISRVRVTNSRVDAQGQVKKSSVETWYSPELREIVRQGDEEDGYTGLIHIQLKDPDPTVFYPPDGYRIESQLPR